MIDDFEDVAAWSAAPSDGVRLDLSPDEGYQGNALRMAIDFHGGGGYAVARRTLSLPLPPNYEFRFRIRGDISPNNLEFKLIDASGENVWWVNRRDFTFPADWELVTIKKRHITFAWGPRGGGELERAAMLEIAVTAGQGGRGSVWIDDLSITTLDPDVPYTLTPAVTASDGAERAERALDGDAETAWQTGDPAGAWLALDFLRTRAFGGLTLDWSADAHATDYHVQLSDNGETWRTVRSVQGGNGGRDDIALPDTDARYVRLAFDAAVTDTIALREITVRPLAWGAAPNAFFEAIARDAPRGMYPRYLTGEASYWTVVGVDGDTHEALIDTDGTVEPFQGGFSIEPFVSIATPADSAMLVTWADARTTVSLADDDLPVPTVQRESEATALAVTAVAAGAAERSVLHLRYAVTNRSNATQRVRLYLAVRPFQVNPSYQFLNTPGGVSRIERLHSESGSVIVNGDRRIVVLDPPTGFGAAPFDGGNIVEFMARGTLPPDTAVDDPNGHASGALEWAMVLEPAETRHIHLAVPWHDPSAVSSPGRAAARAFDSVRAAVEREWASKLNRVEITLPGDAMRLVHTLRSNLAWILINRDGPAIQPGSRAYARSWIRDGALTSAAMLRLGHADAARAFVEWFAPFQYENGKVPCCVDARGADPVPEHDSHGELIFAIAEVWRYTGDRSFLERMWPHVAAAVAHIDSLRQSRRTAEYRTDEKRAFFGLLPESISHEGYSARPVHSYWDDFFALKGLADAADIAAALGRDSERARIAALRDEFRTDLIASFRATMAMHGIDYLPGSVELGDFDATSTTIGIAPAGARAALPAAALARTFDRYWEEFVERRDGADWEAYTPYELRTVGTFIRMGQPERAHAVLDFFFRHQRPAAWNHWAEVVWRDSTAAKFIGDMPHTWVGSDYIRSVLDMLAYTRPADSALVIGTGILEEWVRSGPGVVVRNLRTPHGPLHFTMQARGEDVEVSVDGVRPPAGGIRITSPLAAPLVSATVDGQAVPLVDGGVRLDHVPARVVLRH